MNKKILLTFDLEEFDLPIEYNVIISKVRQLEVATEGLLNILELLKKHQIVVTFFITAYFAENRPALIKKIVEGGHEIASHLYYHSDYNQEHILTSKQKLEEISGIQISGIRSPRLRPLSFTAIKEAGYLYDSSLNPTFIPGRYNNLKKPRKLFKDRKTGLYILPFSVSPIVRFPLFWLSFKNLPLNLYLFLSYSSLKKDGYLHLYFHPWEFANLQEFEIPAYIKKVSGYKLIDKFDKFLNKIKQKGTFTTISKYLNS